MTHLGQRESGHGHPKSNISTSCELHAKVPLSATIPFSPTSIRVDSATRKGNKESAIFVSTINVFIVHIID